MSVLTVDEAIELAVARAVAKAAGGIREEIASLRRSLPPQMGSAADAARVLGVSLSTVKRAIAAGDIPVKRVGTRVLIDLARLRVKEEV